MRINKYCKFLIYLWSTLVFGAVAVFCALLLLLPFIVSLNQPSESKGGAFALFGLFSSGMSFLTVMIAAGIWIGPTLLLLLFGIISAPKEEEEYPGLGTQAFLSGVAIVIALTGFFLFLIITDKTWKFGWLAFSLIIVGVIFWYAFRDNKETDETEPTVQETKRRTISDSSMYCDQCGEKISNNAVFCRYCGNKIGSR